MIGFILWYPDIITNTDESAYIRQAKAFASGERSLTEYNPFTGKPEASPPSPYPPGTSLLMAPFVRIFGWQGAYPVPLFSTLLLVLLSASWLHANKKPPVYALLVLLYPPILILGRVGMSDITCAVLTTTSIVALWRAEQEKPALRLFTSGLCAGSSLLFRETAVLVVAPFFVGTLLRRNQHLPSLILGTLLGSSLRLVASWLTFADPLFIKDPGSLLSG